MADFKKTQDAIAGELFSGSTFVSLTSAQKDEMYSKFYSEENTDFTKGQSIFGINQ